MPRLARVRTLVLGLLGALALVAVPLTQVAHASASATYEKAVYANTDAQRVKHDRVKLRLSRCLDDFAERQARRMAEQQRLYHQNLGPILRKCNLRMVGENVAYGYPTGKAAVNAWMRSPGHRANLLEKSFRLDGVGAVKGKDGRWYVAQVLGRSV